MLRLFLTITFLFSAQTALAWTNEDFRIADTYVAVNINENVEDDCWTNKEEVRVYAGDKLSEVGAILTRDPMKILADPPGYLFRIVVIGYRLNNGTCIGSLSTQLATIDDSGVMHFSYVHQRTNLVNSDNGSDLNTQLLDFVGESIRELN